MRPDTRLADGLRGHFRSVPAVLGATRPPLPQRNSRAGESDEREHRGLDLAGIKTQAAAAGRSHRGRDVYVAVRLSRRLTRDDSMESDARRPGPPLHEPL